MLYYYPNRPILIAADPDNPMSPMPKPINKMERSGVWIAEQKWNGDNILIYTDKMKIWNRHKGLSKYQPTPKVREELEKLPKNCIFNAELVHYKTKTVKNKIIIHCVMAWKGEYLIGKTWGDSRKLIESIPTRDSVIISPIWKKGFWKLFKNADGNIIEGIILKDPTGKIKFSTTPLNDVAWMRKIRKPSKKYLF